jgi:hypothetical protein
LASIRKACFWANGAFFRPIISFLRALAAYLAPFLGKLGQKDLICTKTYFCNNNLKLTTKHEAPTYQFRLPPRRWRRPAVGSQKTPYLLIFPAQRCLFGPVPSFAALTLPWSLAAPSTTLLTFCSALLFILIN